MIDINIEVPDIAEIKAKLGKFQKRAHVVLYRSVNRTLSNTKTNIAKQASGKYIIKQKSIKKTLTVKKATLNKPIAVIRSKGSPIPLIEFDASPRRMVRRLKNGRYSPNIYSSRVLKSGTYKGVERMFYAKGQLMQRPFGATSKQNTNVKNWLRLALSVPQMIGNENVYEEIKIQSMKKLRERIDHEIKYEMGRIEK